MNHFCFALLLLAVGCGPFTSAPLTLHPILVLRQETVDLGEVIADTRHQVTVKFNNHGGESLKFGGIETTCTCSGASVSSSVIPPNGEGELLIGVQPKSSGPGSATIKLLTNCSIHPIRRVMIQWNCVAPVELVDPVFELGSIRPGSSRTFDVVIRCRKDLVPDGKTCRLTKVAASDPQCTFTGAVPQDLSGETPTTVGTMTVKAANTTGDARTRLTMQVEGAFETQLVVQAAWKVVNAIEVYPQRLSLGESVVGSNRVQSGDFIIQSHDEALELGKIESKVDWVQMTQERVSSTISRLTVKRVAELPVGIHSGEVLISVKSPQPLALIVPVSLTISPAKEEEP